MFKETTPGNESHGSNLTATAAVLQEVGATIASKSESSRTNVAFPLHGKVVLQPVKNEKAKHRPS